MAAKKHFPSVQTGREVRAMAGYGIPQPEIAAVFDMDPKTLRALYREDLDKGHIIANSRVAQNLFRIATGEGREAVTAAIFWLKCRAGWSEYSPHMVADDIGKKERQQMEAQTAEKGTGWAGLVH